jgi:hypothetical protein
MQRFQRAGGDRVGETLAELPRKHLPVSPMRRPSGRVNTNTPSSVAVTKNPPS